VLSIILFLLDLIEQRTIWLYILCLVVILYNLRGYLMARSDRVNTIFPVEREVAAHKEGRALSNIGLMLGVAVVATALRFYVAPTIDIEELVEPTPTVGLLIATSTPTATPVVMSPTATPRPSPTRPPAVVVATAVPPAATPLPAPICPDANTCITSPRNNTTVSGVIAIQGTANHAQFQFYKVEHGVGETPNDWHSIGSIVRSPVVDGVLLSFNTASLPNGVYWLKLTVVDITGNFPAPYGVRIVVEN
jgi:hypothetical protein